MLFRRSNGKPIPATSNIVINVQLLNELQTKIKEMESQAELIKCEIKEFMGEFEILEDYNGSKIATWKSQVAKRFQVKEFSEKHPELYQQFLKESQFRTFRLQSR